MSDPRPSTRRSLTPILFLTGLLLGTLFTALSRR